MKKLDKYIGKWYFDKKSVFLQEGQFIVFYTCKDPANRRRADDWVFFAYKGDNVFYARRWWVDKQLSLDEEKNNMSKLP